MGVSGLGCRVLCGGDGGQGGFGRGVRRGFVVWGGKGLG